MVLVLIGGEVSQQLLTLAEPVTQEKLSQTTAHLNRLLAGLAVDEIASTAARFDALGSRHPVAYCSGHTSYS